MELRRLLYGGKYFVFLRQGRSKQALKILGKTLKQKQKVRKFRVFKRTENWYELYVWKGWYSTLRKP